MTGLSVSLMGGGVGYIQGRNTGHFRDRDALPNHESLRVAALYPAILNSNTYLTRNDRIDP